MEKRRFHMEKKACSGAGNKFGDTFSLEKDAGLAGKAFEGFGWLSRKLYDLVRSGAIHVGKGFSNAGRAKALPAPAEAAGAAAKSSSGWGRKALKGAGLAAAAGAPVAAFNMAGGGSPGIRAENGATRQSAPISAAENLGRKFGSRSPVHASPVSAPDYAAQAPLAYPGHSDLPGVSVRPAAPSRKYDSGTGEYDGWKLPDHVAPEVWPDKPLHRGGRFQEYDENVNELRRRMSKGEKIPMRLRNNLSMDNPYMGTDAEGG